MLDNRIRVALVIYDYPGDLDELSQRLGIRPTETNAGTDGGNAKRWVLDSGEATDRDVERHLEDLLKKIKPAKDELREIAKESRCVITLGLEYYEYNPEIVLSPEVLRILASLGTKLWFDIYCLWDGESEHHDHSIESKL